MRDAVGQSEASAHMFGKSLIIITALAAGPVLGVATPAAAQLSPTNGPSVSLPEPSPTRARTRIEVNPQRLLYRSCVDWYELQHRPSGTVLFPEKRCHWVRG